MHKLYVMTSEHNLTRIYVDRLELLPGTRVCANWQDNMVYFELDTFSYVSFCFPIHLLITNS